MSCKILNMFVFCEDGELLYIFVGFAKFANFEIMEQGQSTFQVEYG